MLLEAQTKHASGSMETLHSCSQTPSLSQVLKTLKRQENSLFNCVASCLDDADFVGQIAQLYGTLPAVANLRCGLWYLQQPYSTCYFKSTDGHNGNWSFSCTRLNISVAEEAAVRQGCIIVDATRRGKTFPDALTKTIPIWAAVLNRAVARLRRRQQHQQEQGGGTSPACPPSSWDDDLHLPPWISGNEGHQIRLRLEGWVDQLLQVGADLSRLSRTLRKPLRCLWVSPASRIWADQVVDTSQLDFTPLVLVSASLPNARERRQLALPAESDGGPPLHISYEYVPGAGDDEEGWACGLTPELMWRHRRRLLAAGREGIRAEVQQLLLEGHRHQAPAGGCAGQQGGQLGGEGGGGAVEQQGGLLWAPGVKQKWRSLGRAATDRHHLPPQGCTHGGMLAAAGGGGGSGPAALAASWELPAGAVGHGERSVGRLPCGHSEQRRSQAGEGAGPVAMAGVQSTARTAGVHFLENTGLAIGGVATGIPPGVWGHVEAALNVGLCQHPGMASEGGQGQAAQQKQHGAEAGSAVHEAGAAPGRPDPSLHDESSEGEQQQLDPGHPQPQAQEGTRESSPPCQPVTDPHHSHFNAPHHHHCQQQQPSEGCPQALHQLCQSQGGGSSPQQQLLKGKGGQGQGRYLWLPVPHSKFSRQGLRQALPVALEFVCGHLREGRRVLVHCDDGVDASVCVALAVLLACFRLPTEGQHEGGGGVPGRSPGSPLCCTSLQYQPYAGDAVPAAPGFSKLTVRQYLAVLSQYYPAARPTRGMLKQVYNLFAAAHEEG